MRLVRVDPGFEPAGVLSFELSLPRDRYPNGERVTAFHSELGARLSLLPGVQSVGAIDKLPLSFRWDCSIYVTQATLGLPFEELPCAGTRASSPGYFRAMGIDVIQGRAFTDADRASAVPVAMVNRRLADAAWPGEDPLGKQLSWGGTSNGAERWRTVVGVVEDVRHRGLDRAPSPELYTPFAQAPDRRASFVVLSPGSDVTALRENIERALQQIDPSLPIRGGVVMDGAVAASLGPYRAIAVALGAAGLCTANRWPSGRRVG